MSFADDLKRFSAKTSGNMDQITRTVTMQVANALVQRTPVGNPENWTAEFKEVGQRLGWFGPGYTGGRLRANWQFSQNAPAEGEIDKVDKDGASTIGALIAAIGTTGAGDVTYLTNNLPYAIPIEYGHSKQAPAGMARVTAREFQQYVNQALGTLKK